MKSNTLRSITLALTLLASALLTGTNNASEIISRRQTTQLKTLLGL